MQWVASTLIANAIVTVVLVWLLKVVARRFFRLEVRFQTTYLPVFAGNYLAYLVSSGLSATAAGPLVATLCAIAVQAFITGAFVRSEDGDRLGFVPALTFWVGVVAIPLAIIVGVTWTR